MLLFYFRNASLKHILIKLAAKSLVLAENRAEINIENRTEILRLGVDTILPRTKILLIISRTHYFSYF